MKIARIFVTGFNSFDSFLQFLTRCPSIYRSIYYWLNHSFYENTWSASFV